MQPDLTGISPDAYAFPYLTRLSAQRKIELIALRLAPAVTAAAIAYAHVQSEWQAVLVLASFLGVALVLRNTDYPLHLVPFASATLYLLAPPLGALVALVIGAVDEYPGSLLTAGELFAPVLGAWIVTAIGLVIAHRFRRDREARVAVIGPPEFAEGLDYELRSTGDPGHRVIGWIDHEGGDEVGPDVWVKRLGSLSTLRETVLEHEIELLVLAPLRPTPGGAVPSTNGTEPHVNGAGPSSNGAAPSRLDVFERVAYACLDLPVSMIEAGQLYEELLGHVPLGTTTSAWFQYMLHPRFRGAFHFSKRVSDLVIGGLAALVAAPLLLVGALAVKLSGPGPLFHRQQRLGAGGRPITLVKLRTMRPDAEDDGPRWSGDDDERITPLGRVLRRLHIDELPQIWLVLTGEMSLVGPRPEQPSIVGDLEDRFHYYDRRHLVKPGITGWAQVRCGYGGSHAGSAWKLCHDLYYLKHSSLLFDLLIMLETFHTVVVPEPGDRPDERFIIALRSHEDELATATDEIPAGAKAS
jgi:lipopolysaccharide/colanic/teichoic acid biosynthesis glycosyltransferase